MNIHNIGMSKMNYTFIELIRCVAFMGVLSGCGGGSATPDIQAPPPPPPSTQYAETFFSTDNKELLIDDLYSIVASTCDDYRFHATPELFAMIPIELNTDKYQDLILHYWCSTDPGTAIYDTPTPDALVALVSDGYGNWYVDNYRVFGEDIPRIGGASRKWTKGDFNGDGYEDIAFAVNWEDLRTDDLSGSRWDTEQTVLLSTGDGGFTIERVGTRSHGHAVGAIQNDMGYDDVLFAGMLGTPFQAHRWNLNTAEWEDITDLYPGNGDWSIDIQVINKEQFVTGYCESESCGVALYTKNNNDWQITDAVVKSDPIWVYIDGYQTPVHKIGGYYTVGVATDEMCKLDYFNDTGNTGIAIELWGDAFKYGVDVQEGYQYSSEDLENYRNLMVFEIADDQFVNRTPEEVEHQYRAFFMECADLNNDGMTDIFIQKLNQESYQTDPIIYFNYNGDVTLYEVSDAEHFPDHTEIQQQQLWGGVSRLIDVNGDGLVDLLSYSYHTNDVSDIEVYKGLKPLE